MIARAREPLPDYTLRHVRARDAGPYRGRMRPLAPALAGALHSAHAAALGEP